MNPQISKTLMSLILIISLTSCGARGTVADKKDQNNEIPNLSLQTLPVCINAPNASICVVDIVMTPSETNVELEMRPNSVEVGMGWLAFALPDTERDEPLALSDESGRTFFLKDNANDLLAEYDSEQNVYQQTLVFDAIETNAKHLTLRIPLVSLKIAKSGSFQIDLGSNPQPGQIIPFNAGFSIGDQSFVVNQAEFEGDGTNSLRVTLSSAPMDLPEEIASMQVIFGTPAGMALGFGSKTVLDGYPFRAFADLIPEPGQAPLSGVVEIPIEGVIYNYRGPFEIVFGLP